MKIGILLEGSPKMGGGFFQSLKSSLILLNIEKYKKNIELVITSDEAGSYLSSQKINHKIFKLNKIIKYFSELFEINIIRDLFIKLKIFHPFYKRR